MNVLASFLITIVAAAGAAGFWWYNDIQPKLEEKKKVEADIDEGKRQIDSLKKKRSEVTKLDEEIKELEVKEKKLQTSTVSLEKVVPMLLDSTELIANKFDVKFQDIRISQMIRAEEWNELPVEMTLLGTFSNIGKFMSVVEQRKLVNLADGSMNVSVSAEVDDKTKSPKLSVVLSSKVYLP